jgi:hypothetical protein
MKLQLKIAQCQTSKIRFFFFFWSFDQKSGVKKLSIASHIVKKHVFKFDQVTIDLISSLVT